MDPSMDYMPRNKMAERFASVSEDELGENV